MKFQFARAQSGCGIAFWHPVATIPDLHRPATVFPFRNHALKSTVLQRMVFHLHREAFFFWVETRPFWNRPTFEHAALFQPKVVMETSSRMLLNDVKSLVTVRMYLPRGLRRSFKIALSSVGLQSHVGSVPDMSRERLTAIILHGANKATCIVRYGTGRERPTT